jgi:hypothetical protein
MKMSYLKTSVIGGYDAAGAYKNTARSGHWSVASARRLAARLGLTKASLSHSTSDMSGKGRGSDDGEWDLTTGRKISGYKDRDDSGDIHDLCDEVEGRD